MDEKIHFDAGTGNHDRRLQTNADEVALMAPSLRSLPFKMQTIERHRRWGPSVDAVLMEMHLAGVS